jgi:glutathione synthase/RimK-type ligase-like ATP-grasp enzyme
VVIRRVILAKRERRFSKGSVDVYLVTALVRSLHRSGINVELLEPNADPSSAGEPPNIICNMRRAPEAIQILIDHYNRSTRFINNPNATLNCLKEPMLVNLQEANIPCPRYVVSSQPTTESIDTWPVWMHSTAYNISAHWAGAANTPKELANRWQEAQSSGISKIILCEAIEGPLRKVYCINDYVLGSGSEQARSLVREVGRVFGLEVFGVDLVESRQLGHVVVDVNDWPSFAPVRDTAVRLLTDFIRNALS